MIRKPLSDRFSPAKEIAVYRCESCGVEASFCLGFPAADRDHWFCRAHVPADFFPANRSRRAA